MAKKKGVLQRVALFAGVASFILAVVSAVLLYLRIEAVGSDNPISASLMASAFFFVCVGVVLTIIGRADLPDFRLDP